MNNTITIDIVTAVRAQMALLDQARRFIRIYCDLGKRRRRKHQYLLTDAKTSAQTSKLLHRLIFTL